MNLPMEGRESFKNMLDTFNFDFVLQTKDAFMVFAGLLSAVMIYFNNMMHKSINS